MRWMSSSMCATAQSISSSTASAVPSSGKSWNACSQDGNLT